MKGDSAPVDAEDARKAALERALRDLLVGERRVRIDPTTGKVLDGSADSSLTDRPEQPTIP